MGWADEKMAKQYVHLSTEDLVDSMIIGKENAGKVINDVKTNEIIEIKD